MSKELTSEQKEKLNILLGLNPDENENKDAAFASLKTAGVVEETDTSWCNIWDGNKKYSFWVNKTDTGTRYVNDYVYIYEKDLENRRYFKNFFGIFSTVALFDFSVPGFSDNELSRFKPEFDIQDLEIKDIDIAEEKVKEIKDTYIQELIEDKENYNEYLKTINPQKNQDQLINDHLDILLNSNSDKTSRDNAYLFFKFNFNDRVEYNHGHLAVFNEEENKKYTFSSRSPHELTSISTYVNNKRNRIYTIENWEIVFIEFCNGNRIYDAKTLNKPIEHAINYVNEITHQGRIGNPRKNSDQKKI